ncbi:hypothetical protein [Catenulispora yoronensis]
MTRPRCAELPQRIEEIADLARTATDQPGLGNEERLNRVCAALNLAALVAADCGLPDLAIDFCERQFQIFHAAWPVTGNTAICALQPVVNLARLANRRGDHEAAYQSFDELNNAVHHGDAIAVNGVAVSFAGFTTSASDLSLAAPWLRDVLRVEGTRALTMAGRWQAATEHAARYDDSPERLREHRQVLAVSQILDGQAAVATSLILESVMTEAWERAVALCLRLFAAQSVGDNDTEAATSLGEAVALLRLSHERRTAVFRCRLGSVAIDLIGPSSPNDALLLEAQLFADAAGSDDAYVARELLSHSLAWSMPAPQQFAPLAEMVQKAGLDAGGVPEPTLAALRDSVGVAEAVLSWLLRADGNQHDPHA